MLLHQGAIRARLGAEGAKHDGVKILLVDWHGRVKGNWLDVSHAQPCLCSVELGPLIAVIDQADANRSLI